MDNQNDRELSDLEREYIVNDALVIKETIAQLRAEGKFCNLQCSHCKYHYRENCIREGLQLLKASLKKSPNRKGDNYENHQRIMAESHSKSNVNRISAGTL